MDDLDDDRIVVDLTALEPTAQGRRDAWRDSVTALAHGLAALDAASHGADDPAGHAVDWIALAAGVSPPVLTAAELAATADVGRSTVSKLLATWASEGTATSTPGATARAAWRWTAIPDTTTDTTTAAAPRQAGGGGGLCCVDRGPAQEGWADAPPSRCSSARSSFAGGCSTRTAVAAFVGHCTLDAVEGAALP